MDKNLKKIFSIFVFLIAFLMIPALAMLDWQNDWLLVAYAAFLWFWLFLAVFNIGATILFMLFLLPVLMSLNYYNTEYIKSLAIFNYQELPINPVSIILLVIIIFGITAVFSNWQKIKKLPLKSILLIYFIFLSASVFWTSNKNVVFLGIAYFMAPFSMYILAYIYFDKKEKLIKLLLTLIASSLPALLLTFYKILKGQYFYEELSGLNRIEGPFPHPNLYASYLFIILSVSIFFYFSKKDKNIFKNKTLILYGLILSIIFVLTFSRSAWACLALFFLIFAYLEHNLIMIMAILSPPVILISFLINPIKERVIDIFSYSIFDSMIARKNIWEVAWRQIVKKPILGYGTGTSESIIEASKTWQGGSSLPHNDFVLYALESGIIGVVFFVSYTLGALHYIYKQYLKFEDKFIKIKVWNINMEINFKIIAFGVLSMFAAMIIASFFDSNTRRVITQIFIWAILGSLFAIKKSSNSAKQQAEKRT